MALSMQEWPSVMEMEPSSWQWQCQHNVRDRSSFSSFCFHNFHDRWSFSFFPNESFHPFQLFVEVASLVNVPLLNNRPTREVPIEGREINSFLIIFMMSIFMIMIIVKLKLTKNYQSKEDLFPPSLSLGCEYEQPLYLSECPIPKSHSYMSWARRTWWLTS